MTTITAAQLRVQTAPMDQAPDPEVPERPRPPRVYPAAYRLWILEEYERLDKQGKGALLRREGLYTSLISEWRKQCDKGALAALGEGVRHGARRPIRCSGSWPGCRPRTPACASRSPSRPRCWRSRGNSPRCLQGSRPAAPSPAQRADRPQRPDPDELRAAVEVAVTTLSPIVGTASACRALGWPRSSWYRAHRRSPTPPRPPRPAPAPQPRALSATERQQVLEVLHAERFWDAAPAGVYAALLDEGVYLASVSTMYRLLRAHGETGDRRRHATHPPRVKPELLATAPNRCWSWDITKLAGSHRWTW